MNKDSAIILALDSHAPFVPPGLLTPKILMNLNKCRGCNKMSETFVVINQESFNLCGDCSKKICIKCYNRDTRALDKLNHVCNDCKYSY